MTANNTAVYLIDDAYHTDSWPYPKSCWDTDFRGTAGSIPMPIRCAKSVVDTYPTTLKRDITEQFSGKLTFETMYTVVSGDGFYMGFFGKEEEAFKIIQQGDAFYADDKKLFNFSAGRHHIKIDLDIDRGTAVIYSDGNWAAQCSFTGKAESIASFRYGYGVTDMGEAHLCNHVKLYKNYLVNDHCISTIPGELPCEYSVSKSGKASVARKTYYPAIGTCVYKIEAKKDSEATVSRTFDRAKGVVCFDVRYFLPKKNGKITLGVFGSGKCAVSVSDEYTALYNKDGILRKHSANVWQWLRIEADTDHKTALIRLNGKKVTTIAFENDTEYLDEIKISFEASTASEANFTNLEVFVIPPEPADYVPEPVIPKKKGDYYVGMNICSLWRTGHHKGWDCITPFPDHKPVIGYYDEGVPETADWEIKFFAEHGVDFQLYCWYPVPDKVPYIETPLSSALYGGHMLAKYSDKVKFALLWEATGCGNIMDKKIFRENIVPMWIDYLFSDDRYMTIDNKAVMSMFNPDSLFGAFGGVEEAKEELNYLKEEVKKLGYDDLIIMACSNSTPVAQQMGLDAVHAYSWGQKGYDPEFTKEIILKNMDLGYVHVVPTISSGFNDVGWHGTRYPMLSAEDAKDCLEWCRDEILPRYKNDKDSWKSKFVMLSTWNEYGEGTYMMPSGFNKFGYLDSVRSTFMEDVPHTDVEPTEEQLDRINILHPKGRALLAPFDEKPEIDGQYGIFKKYEFKTEEDLKKWEFFGFTSLEIKDGRLFGHSDKRDPYMLLKDDSFLPFDACKVAAIRAHIRTYKPINQMCCVAFSCSCREDKAVSGNFQVLTDPENIVPLKVNVLSAGLPWQDKITAFRFDPCFSVGDFELVDIEFLSAPPHKAIYLDGAAVKTTQFSSEYNGEMYIPFDTTRILTKLPQMYYKWDNPNQKLLVYTDKEYVFTKGSNKASRDGEEFTLARPLEFYDGLPLIPAKLYAEMLNFDYEETETKILYTTKK